MSSLLCPNAVNFVLGSEVCHEHLEWKVFEGVNAYHTSNLEALIDNKHKPHEKNDKEWRFIALRVKPNHEKGNMTSCFTPDGQFLDMHATPIVMIDMEEDNKAIGLNSTFSTRESENTNDSGMPSYAMDKYSRFMNEKREIASKNSNSYISRTTMDNMTVHNCRALICPRTMDNGRSITTLSKEIVPSMFHLSAGAYNSNADQYPRLALQYNHNQNHGNYVNHRGNSVRPQYEQHYNFPTNYYSCNNQLDRGVLKVCKSFP